jgi:hypothetical protein
LVQLEPLVALGLRVQLELLDRMELPVLSALLEFRAQRASPDRMVLLVPPEFKAQLELLDRMELPVL